MNVMQLGAGVSGIGRRGLRRPSHDWNLIHKPWVIQPCVIAPVLPGETLRRALYQSRVVTDPLTSSLVGWWIEYHWFYVRHGDIDDGSNTLQSMVLDPDNDNSAFHVSAFELARYENYDVADAEDGMAWVSKCLEAVVNAYFRDEGEVWTDYEIGGEPSAQIGKKTWLDSYLTATDYATPDFNVDLDADTTVEASEVARSMAMWDVLRRHGLVDMTYDQYLRQYGVKRPEVAAKIPEWIRSTREWTYPSNTIDASSGAPTSACSWGIRERLDKDRYFPEPGFIFGVTVARPKVYMSNQRGNASMLMRDAYSWLPPSALNDPSIRRRLVPAGEGPIDNQTAAYWVDIGDLLTHGDQFRNYSSSTTGVNQIALPEAGGNRKYATEAMADTLFVDNVTPLEYVRQDGVIRFDISSHVRDVTPTTPA